MSYYERAQRERERAMHKREYNKEPPATEEIVWKTLKRIGDNARERIHKREYSESHHHRVDCL